MDKDAQKLVRSITIAVNAAARRKWGEGRKVNKVRFTGLRSSHGRCQWTYSRGLKNPHTATILYRPVQWDTDRPDFWATVSHELAHCHEPNHGPGFKMVDIGMQDLLRAELAKRGITDAVRYADWNSTESGVYKLPQVARAPRRPRLECPDGWRVHGCAGWWSIEHFVDGYWNAIGVECPTRREAVEDAWMYSELPEYA
jgi:hypothetical protein